MLYAGLSSSGILQNFSELIYMLHTGIASLLQVLWCKDFWLDCFMIYYDVFKYLVSFL